jgi:predicted membrane protein
MSILLLFFPIVFLLAFGLASPLAGFVSRRRGEGALLSLIAAVAYLYFSMSITGLSLLASLLAFTLGVAGLALFMGRRSREGGTVAPT